jgi:hypothetical protein
VSAPGCGSRTTLARYLAAFSVALAGLAVSPQEARACACCTNTGQRYDAVEPLGSTRLDQIGQLRFAPAAEIFTGEADLDTVKGIAGVSSSRLELRVTQGNGRWVFSFRDKSGREGALTLALPKSVAVLAIDPRREEREGGLGPALYREWKLTSPAEGTGIFAPGMGEGQRLTLVLQGWGNNCSSPADATHWTLAVSGPVARYLLYGKLRP